MCSFSSTVHGASGVQKAYSSCVARDLWSPGVRSDAWDGLLVADAENGERRMVTGDHSVRYIHPYYTVRL